MKKMLTLAVSLFALLLAISQSAGAFSDTADHRYGDKIEALQQMGVLTGAANGKFNPDGELTYSAGISLIVKGLGLHIDNGSMPKESNAKMSFPNLLNDAWYSQAFVIASYNNLDIPRNVKASQAMTKEQFAHHLFKGIQQTGDYAFIEPFILIADEKDINPAYANSIQKLLVTNIATLDAKQAFHPKKPITRGEAAAWLHDAIEFVKAQSETPDDASGTGTDPLTAIKLTVDTAQAGVKKVTVTAQAPHPGYGIQVSSIVFEGTNAIIHVKAVLPDPDKQYPQVVTEVKTTTYVGESYTPVLAKADGGSDSDQSMTSPQQPKQ